MNALSDLTEAGWRKATSPRVGRETGNPERRPLAPALRVVPSHGGCPNRPTMPRLRLGFVGRFGELAREAGSLCRPARDERGYDFPAAAAILFFTSSQWSRLTM